MSIFTTRHHARNPQPRRPQDSFAHRLWNDPYHDWMLMVVISAILFGISIGVGFITYFSVKGSLAVPAVVVPTNPASLFNVNVLSTTLQNFEARTAEREAAKKGYSGVADPSI